MNLSLSYTLGCGCRILSDLPVDLGYITYGPESEKKIASRLCQTLRTNGGQVGASLVLFGDGVDRRGGEVMATFIESAKLGKVVASEIVKNLQHANDASHKGFQVWLWYVDQDAVNEMYDVWEKDILKQEAEAKEKAARYKEQALKLAEESRKIVEEQLAKAVAAVELTDLRLGMRAYYPALNYEEIAPNVKAPVR